MVTKCILKTCLSYVININWYHKVVITSLTVALFTKLSPIPLLLLSPSIQTQPSWNCPTFPRLLSHSLLSTPFQHLLDSPASPAPFPPGTSLQYILQSPAPLPPSTPLQEVFQPPPPPPELPDPALPLLLTLDTGAGEGAQLDRDG